MIKNLTFSGGTHVDENKHFSESAPLERSVIPKIVHLPLLQGVGSECKPTVKVGDLVKVGQVVGESDANLSAFVHSSISGQVKKLEKKYTAEGKKVTCITIEGDGESDDFAEFNPVSSPNLIEPKELVKIAKEAGIVGMGGAGFPFGVKLNGAIGSDVDSIIANGAECEPFLTSDHKLMLEYTDDVLKGVELTVKAVNANSGYIAIEDNKQNAIDEMDKAATKYENIVVASLKTKYPQGDSTRIIDAVLDRKVPVGARSGAVNAFVSNVGTFKALSDAVYEGKPLYERIISVTGPGVKTPKNIMARIGTPIIDLINECGGLVGDVVAVIAGGPMSGNQVFSLDDPVTKTITGLVVLTKEAVDLREESPCIICNECRRVCPSKLNPAKLNAATLKEKFEFARELHVEECIQCGACSYVCPAKRHLAESIKLAINEIRTKLD